MKKRSQIVKGVAGSIAVVAFMMGCAPQPPVQLQNVSVTNQVGENNQNTNMMPAPSEPTNAMPTPVNANTNTNSQPTPTAPAMEAVTITMTAKNWEFSPSTVTVKKGQKVKLVVTSTDVTHGIVIPDFGVSANIAPGKPATVEFVADKTGTFSFFCSVFCGAGHRSMKGTLVVTE